MVEGVALLSWTTQSHSEATLAPGGMAPAVALLASS